MVERNRAVLIGIRLTETVDLMLLLWWGKRQGSFLEVGEGSKISASFLDNPLEDEDVPEIACARSFLKSLAEKQMFLKDAGLEIF